LKLSDHQAAFLLDVCQLIGYCKYHEIKVTGGELFRTEYQQKEYLRTGKSKTMNSMHLKRLAIDLNFFIDGVLTYDKNKLENIGRHWQGLSEYNEAGMFWKFKDTNHFQRNIKPRLTK